MPRAVFGPGAPVAHLAPGQCFGDLPRTGTVRVATNAALHVGVWDRDRFLTAVTGLATGAAPARNAVPDVVPAAA